MTKTQMLVTDLHSDLLKIIIVMVAKSSSGAVDLANTLSVCKVFMKVADDEDVLKAVDFDNVKLSDRYEKFQLISGLLTRCANAGNMKAEYMLAKVVLVSFSRVLAYLCGPQECHREANAEEHLAYSFLGYIREAHCLLVSNFLCRCIPEEVVEMRQHLIRYFEYFLAPVKGRLIDCINEMYTCSKCIISYKAMERKFRDGFGTSVVVTGEMQDGFDLDTSVAFLEGLSGRIFASCKVMRRFMIDRGNEEMDVNYSLELEERCEEHIKEFNKLFSILKAILSQRRYLILILQASKRGRLMELFHLLGVEAENMFEESRNKLYYVFVAHCLESNKS